ncbi:MAG TPA: alpha/beta fold hydrolase [Candidatus Udaeobacter sp.]|nr:alpha/beta fold hydrolase [Candidatus Udaeobacter sp.]
MTICSLAGASDARAAAPAKPGRGTGAHRAGPATPYRSLEVRVRTRDGQTLGGTLTLPAGTGRRPAVLVLSTADTTDRDGTGGHGFYRPYRQIADTLSRNGIAVLRLDDRGVGRSTGRLDTLDTADRAEDARDALKFLRARPEIDARRVGIVGHSEGASIAEMVATGDTAVRALVVMGSPAYIGRETWEWRERRGLKSAPYSPAVREKLFKSALVQWQARIAKDRWARFFDSYDPLVAARKVRAPILILQGDEDLACPPASADVLAGAIRGAGNDDVTVQHLVGVDHAFLRVRDFDQGVAYGEGAYRLGSNVLGRIVAWMVPHLK